jgi:hypothetical protein
LGENWVYKFGHRALRNTKTVDYAVKIRPFYVAPHMAPANGFDMVRQYNLKLQWA